MRLEHCGFSGQDIGITDRAVIITAPNSVHGPYEVWVKEDIFFNWFAARFIERLPGLKEERRCDDQRVRWVFNPEIFACLVDWKVGKVLYQLLSTNLRNTVLYLCPIPMPQEPLSLEILDFPLTGSKTGLFSPQPRGSEI